MFVVVDFFNIELQICLLDAFFYYTNLFSIYVTINYLINYMF